jgi:hypothetical protein
MTDYSGPDKLVGTLLANVSTPVQYWLYWEDYKSIDVQRYINSVVLAIEQETQEYGGFGRESWKDVDVVATIFLYQFDPLGLSDEDTLESLLMTMHTTINQYNNSSTGDTIVGNKVIWVKITDEERMDDLRGAIVYTVNFQVRVYIPQVITAAGSSSTGLMQLMVNFLSGLPAPQSGTWSVQPFSEVKSLDLQRTGDIVAIHAPVVDGRVVGLGEGQVGGQYTQQQMSKYKFRVTLYGQQESDIVSATDWVSQNIITYFLNADFGNGETILAKVLDFGQILNERGVWWRELKLVVEAIVGP